MTPSHRITATTSLAIEPFCRVLLKMEISEIVKVGLQSYVVRCAWFVVNFAIAFLDIFVMETLPLYS